MCVSALGMKTLINPRAQEIAITGSNGVKKNFDPKALLKIINVACADLDSKKTELLYSRVEYSIFGGMSEEELKDLTINSSKYLEPFYPEFAPVSKKLIAEFH
ncbi:MAG TPA: hypothetical protein VG965_02755 [Patescibacteria group bacterium]|nr:hypothetical protein [Patescibacteria group bacterium]